MSDTQHRTNKKLFPLNPSTDTHMLRNREVFKFNRARTEEYKKSAVPYLQKQLNAHFMNKSEAKQMPPTLHPGL